MVGGISEADVYLAHASDAVILGFNVVPDEGARSLADRNGVQIRRYDIIYKLTEDIRAALGRDAQARPTRNHAGPGLGAAHLRHQPHRHDCRLPGAVGRRCNATARVRVIRDNRIIGDYALESLKREKDDAREVREGLECGIKLGGFNDLKEGDVSRPTVRMR